VRGEARKNRRGRGKPRPPSVKRKIADGGQPKRRGRPPKTSLEKI